MKADHCVLPASFLPNALTVLRAAASFGMLCTPLYSVPFYTLYALCGLTDLMDGLLARRLHTAGTRGAILDSAADLIFALCVAIRFLPAALLPVWTVVCIACVAMIRLCSLICCYVRFRTFALLHTWLNSIAGLCVFLCIPLYPIVAKTPLLIAVCAFAFLSAIEELLLMLSMPFLNRDKRSIFPLHGTRFPSRVTYRLLRVQELALPLFRYFERYQKVSRCWRKRDGVWTLEPVSFTEDWNEAEYRILCSCLTDTLKTGGAVYGAFSHGTLVGFASVENGRFGEDMPIRENDPCGRSESNKVHGAYLQLSSLYVSRESRNTGIGRMLFHLAASAAKARGAHKLYISAHSSEESMAFYHAMGCVEALCYNKKLADAEPCDCQLEFVLL